MPKGKEVGEVEIVEFHSEDKGALDRNKVMVEDKSEEVRVHFKGLFVCIFQT
jgi:hypothetical protein